MSDEETKIIPNVLKPVPFEFCDFMYDVCRKFVPTWGDMDFAEFHVEELNGGLTNRLYKAKFLNATDQGPSQVVVRFFGKDVDTFFERAQEQLVALELSQLGYGVQIFNSFSLNGGGRVEAFHKGRTLECADLSNPVLSAKIARSLAKLHSLDVPISREPVLPQNLTRWLSVARAMNVPVLTSKASQVVYEFTQLEDQIKWFLSIIPRVKSPVVFCHNDLQEGNILYDEPSGHIQVIDYEYSAYNFRGFDLGNHFCEHFIDYHAKVPPYFKLDLKRYPSMEHQKRFLNAYRTALQQLKPDSFVDSVDQLYLEAQYFMMASDLMWATWAVIQSVKSDIAFGYMEYAHARLANFFHQKEKVVAELPLPDELRASS